MSKRMSAAEQANKASSAKKANELAVQASERMDERVAQYSMSLFLNHSAHCPEQPRIQIPDVSTGPLAHPLACTLAPLTRSLALLASLARSTALIRLFTHSLLTLWGK